MATKKKRKRSFLRKKRNTTGTFKSLSLFLLAVLILGSVALMLSYFILKKDRQEAPEVSEITVSKVEPKQDAPHSGKEGKNTSKTDIEVEIRSPLQGQTWVSTYNGAMLAIEGHRYTLDFPSVEEVKPMMGAISFTANGFRLVNHNQDDVCNNESGVYTFYFEGDELIIKVQNDPCIRRSTHMEAAWFKL